MVNPHKSMKNSLPIVLLFFVFTFLATEAVENAYMKSHAVLTASKHFAEADDRTYYHDSLIRPRRAATINTEVRGFTVEEAVDIVNQHNIKRTNTTPPAANMQKMMWNELLEGMAQEWAEKCRWDHGYPERDHVPWPAVGQNIYIYGSNYDAVQATDLWWGEIKYFTYNIPNGIYHGLKGNCTPGEQCGHYTQVAWHNSWAIGCGVKYCDHVERSSTNPAYLVVCNYGPSGNYAGDSFYTQGTPCTKCPSHKPRCTTGDPVAGLCDWPAPCNNYKCANNGTLYTDACICSCPEGFFGQFCNATRSSGVSGMKHTDGVVTSLVMAAAAALLSTLSL